MNQNDTKVLVAVNKGKQKYIPRCVKCGATSDQLRRFQTVSSESTLHVCVPSKQKPQRKRLKVKDLPHCITCGALFSTNGELVYHYRNVHPDPKVTYQHLCVVCGRMFSDLSHLHCHFNYAHGLSSSMTQARNHVFLQEQVPLIQSDEDVDFMQIISEI